MSALTDRLDEWAALADAATPGPWWQSAPGLVYGKDRFEEGYAEAVAQATPGNGDFITASRTAVPTLVEALRAVLALHRENGPDDDACQGFRDSGYGYMDHWCVGCSDCSGREYGVAWPCPTAVKITAALGVEP